MGRRRITFNIEKDDYRMQEIVMQDIWNWKKVADCMLLFSLDKLEAVPLDDGYYEFCKSIIQMNLRFQQKQLRR